MSEQDIKCWACFEKSGEVKPWAYTPRPLGPKDVEIKIHCCGICGSDLHQMDSGWGPSIYPIVPGHEIIGEITKIGSEVTRFTVGTRAGVGAQCYSCGTCEQCTTGYEQSCDDGVYTYNAMFDDGSVAYGGYSTFIRVDERFAFKIPDSLPSEKAAPLLCAGVTTYSPMIEHGVKEGTKVGVLGIGGLGHLALKWGKALGAEVTAISSTAEKERDAKALGADRFICSKDRKQMGSAKRSLDIIISTVSANLNWSDYIRLLKPRGKLIFVGLPEEKLEFKPFDFVSTEIMVAGSSIGSPSRIEAMLKLAGEKNITAEVQTYPIEQVNDALKGFREGKPQYRFVLQITGNSKM